jgi:hypothetical protein
MGSFGNAEIGCGARGGHPTSRDASKTNRKMGHQPGGFRMRALLAVGFAIALDGVACAQDHYDVRGVGVSSCAAYANMFRKGPDLTDAMFSAWAMGYISGINVRSEAASQGFFDLNAKSLDEMIRYLRRYCDIHPLANYRDEVLEFMKSLPPIPSQK